MTTMTVPGISAAEQHYLEQGAREFFERQGAEVLAEFARREGGNTLTADFGALAAPATLQEPDHRLNCVKHDNGPHFYI